MPHSFSCTIFFGRQNKGWKVPAKIVQLGHLCSPRRGNQANEFFWFFPLFSVEICTILLHFRQLAHVAIQAVCFIFNDPQSEADDVDADVYNDVASQLLLRQLVLYSFRWVWSIKGGENGYWCVTGYLLSTKESTIREILQKWY